MPQPRVKRLLTFPIDDDLRERLQRVREDVGIPVAEQIRRGVRMWLEEQPAGAVRGRKTAPPKRRHPGQGKRKG